MHHTTPHRSAAALRSQRAVWSAIVPVKRMSGAKTRLLPKSLPPDARADLVLAFATDTVRAVLSCPRIEAVVVVTEDDEVARRCSALGARIVADDADSSVTGHARLNAAIVAGEAVSAAPVCALTADLPALRPDELDVVLAVAAQFRRSFLADRHGTGTALLAATLGHLEPGFGAGSALRHERSGAIGITVPAPSVRLDVDEPEDLQAALRLGVGPATRRAATALATSPRAPDDRDTPPWPV